MLGAYESGSLTAATTTLLTSATYPYKTNLTNAEVNTYKGCELYVTSGTAPVPNPVAITTYSPSAGTFVPSIDYTTSPGATATFDIYKKGIRLSEIKNAVNAALRDLRYPTIIPLSLLADADCDESGVTSWGTAVNATASKVTSSGNLLRGMRALRVLNSAANGYLPSAAKVVETSHTYYVQARVGAASGTAKLIAYDATNSAEIDSDTWDETDWGTIYFSISIPSTCKSLTLRLSGVEATADIYWDDVILLKANDYEFALPDWVTKESYIQRVVAASQSEEARSDQYSDWPWWRLYPDLSNPLAAYKLAISPGISRPLWIWASRPFAVLSADTDTTFSDRNLVELASCVKLLDVLMDRAPSEETKIWKEERRKKGKELAALLTIRQPLVPMRLSFGTPQSAPSPAVAR